MKSVVLIPARMESTRFPNKPLALILGKPMIQWVYEAAEKSIASDVFVITDSEEIIKAVESFNGQAILTSSSPVNGTERCQEAIEILESEDQEYDVIINVQGDEPLVSPDDIDLLLELFEDEEIDVATLIKPIDDEAEYLNNNVVKAVPTAFDGGFCDICYFSRSPIPHMDKFEPEVAFKHVGIYGFTATAFEEIKNLGPSELETVERLEQLRWLQNHIVISAVVTESDLIGVDTPDDIVSVEKLLQQQ
ncbi:MAG: 3-deoxy-manno-octulosonate cytidylyltransferase [Bacteroidia bacterium]|nr:3-deoxy-manno-octulosonate cytidylyltransferase [Bacteroidia bacterium]NNJ54716.1 3-deoxy-manno-octulosonate cytidylyltransferase [Bacteroidia bacterium]